MSLIEVKNNLLKFCYEDDLFLSGFVRVSDSKNSYIAQVLHLEATRVGKVAIAKILFMCNNGEISSYNGSIPSLRAEVSSIDSSILLDTLEKHVPLNLGTLAQQNKKLFVDLSVLKDNPIICAEKFFATKVFLNNLAIQLQLNNKKVIVFDTVGIFNSNKLTVSKDFKLPLNTSAINYIYEHEFADATDETKALIQSIFEELSEYSKTVPFIPFNTFKSVVDAEFNRTKLIQLVLLKNKIKQISDMNIYGETAQDFALINSKLQSDNTIIVDISAVTGGLQKEVIKYVYGLLSQVGEEFYSFLPLTNENTDKEVLNQVYQTENVYTTVVCGYDYAYLNNLKQKSKNMFMFTPLKQQKDFGGYNIFLQKLAEDECIAYGKMTKFVPLITKVHPIKSDEIIVTEQTAVTSAEKPERVDSSMVKSFVNAITPESINLQTEPVTEAEASTAPTDVAETHVAPIEEVDDEEFEEDIEEEEFASMDDSEDIVPAEPEVIEAVSEQEEEASDEPEPAEIMLEPEVTEAVLEPEAAPAPQEPQTATEEELAQALNEVPEIEEDEELSDDDLDMIEKLSNQEEEVAQPQTQEEPIQPQEEAITAAEEVTAPQPQAAAMTPPQPERPQVMENTNPVVPEYSAEIPDEDKVGGAVLQQGDKVMHDEFGAGIVEKMINYGDKELCSINFESVGRRLLNPEITEMRKI